MKLLIPALLLLSACATTKIPEPIIKTVEVKVPVGIPCIPNTYGPPPVYVDSNDALRAAADAAERYQLLWAGRAQRIARQAESDAVISGCPRGSAQ